MTRRSRLPLNTYQDGICNGDRFMLSRAITLLESQLPADQQLAAQLVTALLPHTGKAWRIGITGVPGVGKSTFIEAFGTYLANNDHRVAVLAVDPSSNKSGGSIMGDKTRMEQLAHHPNAYIRPSATGTSLGGVASKTRESMLLCEAAGYDVILVETVGVGQSEVAVKGMVDFFLLLMLAGAGDELQGIKKGIMEMADAIAITKADGDNIKASTKAATEYRNALHLFRPAESRWSPKVLTCSSVKKTGIQDIWQLIKSYYNHMAVDGRLEKLRRDQNMAWMHENVEHQLKQSFYNHPEIARHIDEVKEAVGAGRMSSLAAAQQLLGYFRHND